MEIKSIKTTHILIIIALLAFGVLIAYKVMGTEKEIEEPTNVTPQEQAQNVTATDAPVPVSKFDSENPPEQGDVVGRPTYLVSAYTRHEKDYVGLDYVLVFHGEEAVQAQIEDGLCSQESECQISPEGYIRNNNPHFRAYEISTTTPLTIEVSGAIRNKALEMGLDVSSLTFENLKEILPAMPAYTTSEFPFKEPKSFVRIDIIGEGVTKILEP